MIAFQWDYESATEAVETLYQNQQSLYDEYLRGVNEQLPIAVELKDGDLQVLVLDSQSESEHFEPPLDAEGLSSPTEVDDTPDGHSAHRRVFADAIDQVIDDVMQSDFTSERTDDGSIRVTRVVPDGTLEVTLNRDGMAVERYDDDGEKINEAWKTYGDLDPSLNETEPDRDTGGLSR